MNIADKIVQIEKRLAEIEKDLKALKMKDMVRGSGNIRLNGELIVDKSAKISEILNRLDALEI